MTNSAPESSRPLPLVGPSLDLFVHIWRQAGIKIPGGTATKIRGTSNDLAAKGTREDKKMCDLVDTLMTTFLSPLKVPMFVCKVFKTTVGKCSKTYCRLIGDAYVFFLEASSAIWPLKGYHCAMVFFCFENDAM